MTDKIWAWEAASRPGSMEHDSIAAVHTINVIAAFVVDGIGILVGSRIVCIGPIASSYKPQEPPLGTPGHIHDRE